MSGEKEMHFGRDGNVVALRVSRESFDGCMEVLEIVQGYFSLFTFPPNFHLSPYS